MFAYDGNEGRTSTIEHTIKLTDNTPVASRYRRTPNGWRHEIESEVQRLRNNGVIRSSTSSYAAPICPVKKKDGTMRLCIDYRQLNARTKSDAFPTGNVLDVIDNMAGARYFSTIDLAQGYHQVPVAEADREKTAFRTSSGLWEFTRMPFGLKGAPATFCRLMARVLGHMSPTQLALYMDDICVISTTFDSHLERLEVTFKNLLVHGLRIKGHKCSFAMAEVIFCGHKLSADGIQPSSTKLDAISRLPVPSTPTEVKTFLGATGWYRKFIRNYATTATPLTKLTHAGVAFNWTHECQTAFETLKLQLMKSPLLSHIRPVGTLVLTTDASTVGLGAELAQETHEGTHPVAFFSRAMTKTERNYSTYDRELLAIVSAIRHFRHHLLGRRFVLRTDHRPLQYFPVTRDPWGRRARWLAELQLYDFSIQYVEGTQNCVADALSRLGFAKEPTDTIANVTSHDKSSQFLEDDIRTAQAADSDIAVVIRLLQSRRLPSADASPSVKSFYDMIFILKKSSFGARRTTRDSWSYHSRLYHESYKWRTMTLRQDTREPTKPSTGYSHVFGSLKCARMLLHIASRATVAENATIRLLQLKLRFANALALLVRSISWRQILKGHCHCPQTDTATI